jgi:hypothetical protein
MPGLLVIDNRSLSVAARGTNDLFSDSSSN